MEEKYVLVIQNGKGWSDDILPNYEHMVENMYCK